MYQSKPLFSKHSREVLKAMQDNICSHCKHVHICSIDNIYDKTQELIAPPEVLFYLPNKTTPAMYTRNTALSAEVIYDWLP